MKKEDKRLEYINSCVREAESGWQSAMNEFEEDFDFYANDAWRGSDKAIAKRKGIPALNLNYTKKQVDIISGWQRQNRTDIKYFPLENGDVLQAELLSRIAKWVTSNKKAEYTFSSACEDAAIGGLGWVHPYMSYEKDPLNGDILFKKISPFNILPDPYFIEPDLSDCSYIIRWQRTNKDKLCSLYPKHKKGIQELDTVEKTGGILKELDVGDSRDNTLLVVEFWERVYVQKTVVQTDGDLRDWQDVKDQWRQIVLTGMTENGFEPEKPLSDDEILELVKDRTHVITTRQPKIKLTAVIEETLIVFEGENPYGTSDYPFVPVFAYYNSSQKSWEKRLQGIIRPLKDMQREKNKRRSQIIQQMGTSMRGGWVGDKGAVDDVNVLRNSAGYDNIIEKNPGKNLERVSPPPIDNAAVQVEMMFEADMRQVGMNPDLLGLMNSPSDAGITVQLRQKQGMTALQAIVDGQSLAMKTLGALLCEMILNNFTREKIERIAGPDLPFYKNNQDLADLENKVQQLVQSGDIQEAQQEMNLEKLRQEAEKEFWDDWEKARYNSRYDCIPDETTNSQTYRMAALFMMTQLQQSGADVPMEVMIELSDIPEKAREQIKQLSQKKEAMQQQQLQIEQQKLQNEAQMEQKKLELETLKIQQKIEQQKQEHEATMTKLAIDMQKND